MKRFEFYAVGAAIAGIIRKIKSYLVFTPVIYRVIVFLLLPLALAGLGIKIGNSLGFPAELFVLLLFPMTEAVADYWIFGGIAAKNQTHLEYLKSSNKGKRLLKDALTGDLLRRFISECIVLFAIHMVTWQGNWTLRLGKTGMTDRVMWFAAVLLAGYFFSILAVAVSRFFQMIQAVFLSASGVMVLAMLSEYFIITYTYAAVVLFLILGIGISVVTIYIAMKRVEESYYDKTV